MYSSFWEIEPEKFIDYDEGVSFDAPDGLCGNCGGWDFREDAARGDVVCGHCGLVVDQIFLSAPNYKDTYHSDGSIKAGPPNAWLESKSSLIDRLYGGEKKSQPYQRETYLNERLAQLRELEPKLPKQDIFLLISHYEKNKKRFGDNLTKEDIRTVLAEVDTQVAQKRFVRLYLEKWLSIRHYLTGEPSSGKYITDDEVYQVRKLFRRVEEAFDTVVSPTVDRSSFLNYNFVMRRIFDWLNLSWVNEELPPLKTAKKQKRLIEMWVVICGELGLPYINTDRTIFPTKIFSDYKWQKRV